MNARNRVFMILGLLTLGSLIWYLLTARTTGDLQLIGTVDANEVEVSSKIPGRIQTLTVEEGQDVKAGQLIAVIESQDLAAAHQAAEATVSSQQAKLKETIETERQTRGETSSQTVNAEAQVRATQAALAQAQANLEHQQADTQRTVALAKQGIVSKQASDEAAASLKAYEAAVETAKENVAAAEASLRRRRRMSCRQRRRRTRWFQPATRCNNAQGAFEPGGGGAGLFQGVCPGDGQGERSGRRARAKWWMRVRRL